MLFASLKSIKEPNGKRTFLPPKPPKETSDEDDVDQPHPIDTTEEDVMAAHLAAIESAKLAHQAAVSQETAAMKRAAEIKRRALAAEAEAKLAQETSRVGADLVGSSAKRRQPEKAKAPASQQSSILKGAIIVKKSKTKETQ